jgi:copper transport protein
VPTSRRVRRALGLLGLALVWAVLVAQPAAAHTRLVDTSPAEGRLLAAAPATVELRFNEPVGVVASGFALYDSNGRHTVGGEPSTVTAGGRDRVVTASLPPSLADGSYLLSWRVVSADGHPVAGVLAFAVGAPSDTAPVALGPVESGAVDTVGLALQVVGYLGLLGATGLWVFRHLVLSRTDGRGQRSRLVTGGLVLALAAGLLLVGVARVQERGGRLRDLLDPGVWADGLSSAPAAAAALVAAGLLLLLVAGRVPARVGRWLGGGAVALALASVLATGHTRTVEPGWLVATLDLVHVAAAAVWFGGLVGLGLHLRRGRREEADATAAAAVVARFSGLAGVLVGLLGLSGILLALLVLERPSGLVTTAYGRTLLVKLALVGVIALLALWNRFHLVGSVQRRAVPAARWRRLRGAVVDEALVLVAALAVTGVLTTSDPDAPVAPDPSTASSTAGGVREAALGAGTVQLQVQPGRVGTNTVELNLRGPDGSPLDPAEVPEVSASLPDAGLGPLPATVREIEGTGRYRAEVGLPVAGSWQLVVSVRTGRFDQPSASVTVPVSG